MNEVVKGLTLLKDAFLHEQEELDLCNIRFWELNNEISEIEYLIEEMERREARRQREHERRFRHLKRVRNKELRKRIYLGLRMEPVSSHRNNRMEYFRSHDLGGGYGKKNSRRYRFQGQKV